jgi:hypothetical protein
MARLGQSHISSAACGSILSAARFFLLVWPKTCQYFQGIALATLAKAPIVSKRLFGALANLSGW